MRFNSFYSFILLLLLSAPLNAQNQSDYTTYPDTPLDYLKVDMSIALNPDEGLLSGRAAYSTIAKRDQVVSFALNSRESSIQAIVSDGNSLDFEVRNDSILVSLADSLQKDDPFDFEITWQSQTIYGYHVDAGGNMWASTMPMSNRNWLPGFDHPSNELQVEATYSVPEDYFAVANGDLLSDEIIVGEGRKELKWSTSKSIPFSSIGFAAGRYEMEEIRAGVKKIRVFRNIAAEQNNDSTDVGLILENSRRNLLDIENLLDREFPFESLNIVFLEDRFGDIFDLTAGMIFLEKGESKGEQLNEMIAAQWLGVDLQASTMETYRSVIQPFARYKLGAELDETQQKTAKLIFPLLNRWLTIDETGALSWKELALQSYKEFGLWMEEVPSLRGEATISEKGLTMLDMKEQQYYLASFKLSQDFTELTLIMTSNVDKQDSLHSATLYEYVFGDTLTTEFSFSGSSDTLTFEVSPNLEYALIGRSDTDVRVFESKPISFWLAQLRSQEPALRAQAASGLVSYADEPDLQLALNDALKSEENAEVQAAIYTTLSAITSGDIGTEQTFLPLLNRESPELQLAGTEALSAYPGNEQVSFALRNKILRTDDDQIFNSAFNSFIEVSDSSEVIALIDRLSSADISPEKYIYLLNRVLPVSSDSAVIERMLPFTASGESTETRLTALQNLQNIGLTEQMWDNLVADLIRDPHPLIRKKGYALTQKCSPEQAELLRAEVEMNEFDNRVTGGSY